jgi:hypothetical protein
MAPGRGEWLVRRSSLCTSAEVGHGTHWIGAGVEMVAKREIPASPEHSIRSRPSLNQSLH